MACMAAASLVIDVRLLDHPVRMVPIDPFPPEAGGECVFLGRTRLERHPQHGELRQLSYDVYHEMAERLLREIAQQAIERFGCVFVRIHHSVGEVPIGQASVLVQVACGHRDKAFEACRFLIDQLKREAPIWKRERWERGETWSEAASVPGGSAKR